MSQKRRSLSVPLHQKLKALQQMKEGISAVTIADCLGVHPATVKAWKKSEGALKEWEDECIAEVPTKKKRLKKTANELVDKAMVLWCKEQYAAGQVLTGSTIRSQALKFHRDLGAKGTFSASRSWLSKFKDRHGFRLSNFADKSDCADPVEPRAELDPQAEVRRMIDGLTPDQIFSCKETTISYRSLPGSGDSGQERITVMLCSSASGRLKLPPLLVSNSDGGDVLKHMSSPPVFYRYQKCACLTEIIFDEWFEREFVPAVDVYLRTRGLPVKALLFMGNSVVHSDALVRGDVRTVLLPLRNDAILQPIDESLDYLKYYCRVMVMASLLVHLNSGDSLGECVEKIAIKEVAYWVANAWESVPVVKIKKSWTEIGVKYNHLTLINGDIDMDSVTEMQQEEENDVHLRQLVAEKFCRRLRKMDQYKNLQISDVNQWLNSTSEESLQVLLNDEEIVNIVREGQNLDSENYQDFEEEEIKPFAKLSVAEAREALHKVIEHCTGNAHYSRENILGLQRVKDRMVIESVLSNGES